ncbi:elongation factor 1-beta [Candidatus Woesearchaeota archaeon]|nr:elongation factor 1-beta [Candidatus Woesearchaeota archaeon]
MADVIVTLKIMPESPEVNLKAIQISADSAIKAFGGEVGKVETEPIAFGLKALKIIFVMDEAKGATDPLEEKISALAGVNSVEVTDIRRAIG